MPEEELKLKCPKCGHVLDAVKINLEIDTEEFLKSIGENLVEEIRKRIGEKL